MRKLLTAGVAALGLTLAAPMSASLAEELTEINFGIISTESSAALAKNFDPFLKEMEKALGVKVNAFFAQDYAGVIEGMRFDKVDVAWFGNKSAMEAVDRAGGEIFAQTTGFDGSMGYYSLIIANKANTEINSLEDVLNCDAELTFGNGDPNSTSGFLVPSYYVFALNNVDPNECYKRVINSNHEGNALAVANNKVDIATNNTESLYARLEKTQPEMAAKIKEVWRSPLIPSDPMVWRANLPDEVKADMLSFFMSFGRIGSVEEVRAEREILRNLSDGWGPFIASSNAQLYPIRQLELFRDKIKLENDNEMAAGEKETKLAEINAELDELNTLMEELPNM